MLDNSSKYIVIQPKGNSMKPFIIEGDSVIVEKNTKSIKKYDVVLFENDNGLILHRVLKLLDNNHILVCGDNQLTTEIIAINQVIGVAKGVEKDGKANNFDGIIYKLLVRLWCIAPLRRFAKWLAHLRRKNNKYRQVSFDVVQKY